MNSKGKGILAALGAGAIGIMSLFLFGKMKKNNETDSSMDLFGGGSAGGGYEIGIDFDDLNGVSTGGGIGAGTSVILPDPAMTTTLPETVQTVPDGNRNDVYGMTSSFASTPSGLYEGINFTNFNPGDWYLYEDDTNSSGGFQMINAKTGEVYNTSQNLNDFIRYASNPEDSQYNPLMAEAAKHAQTYGTKYSMKPNDHGIYSDFYHPETFQKLNVDQINKDKATDATPEIPKYLDVHQQLLSEGVGVPNIFLNNEPAGSSSGRSNNVDNIATSEKTPEPPAKEKTKAKIPEPPAHKPLQGALSGLFNWGQNK